MSVFDEVLLAQKREKEREERFSGLLSTFDLLSRDEQLTILGRLASRYETGSNEEARPAQKTAPTFAPRAPSTTSIEVAPAVGEADSRLHERALTMLKASRGGVLTMQVTRALYARGGGLKRSDVGKARAVLSYLKERGEAHSDGEGRWFAGAPPTNGAAREVAAAPEDLNHARETALARRVVAESPNGLDIAGIVTHVLQLSENAQKTSIYSAVYKMAASGRFTKHPDGTYTINPSYRPTFRKVNVAK